MTTGRYCSLSNTLGDWNDPSILQGRCPLFFLFFFSHLCFYPLCSHHMQLRVCTIAGRGARQKSLEGSSGGREGRLSLSASSVIGQLPKRWYL